MANLGSLIIGAQVVTDNIGKGFKSITSSVGSFVGSFGTAQSALVAFAGAAGVGLAVNALKDLALQQLDSIDQAADLAAQLGTSTGSLQALQYAVNSTGSDSATLNSALQKMTQNLANAGIGAGTSANNMLLFADDVDEAGNAIADVGAGSGFDEISGDANKAGKALKSLGLDANELLNMSPEESFKILTGALEGVSTESGSAGAALRKVGIDLAELKALDTATAFDRITEGLDGISASSNGLQNIVHNSGAAAQALATLGLPIEELLTDDPVHAFAEIADALSGIENPAQQAALAADLFGAANVSLLNSINEGPEALQALMAEAEKLGVSLSDVDVNQVTNAKAALDKVGFVMEGIGNKIIVAVAPYIEAAAKAFSDFASDGVMVGNIIGTVSSGIIEGIAFMADALHFASSGWYIFAGIVQANAAVSIAIIGGIATAIDYLLDAVGIGASGVGKAILNISKTYGDSATENFRKAGAVFSADLPGDKFRDFANGIKTDAMKAAAAIDSMGASNKKVAATVTDLTGDISKLNASLKEQVQNFGLSSAEAEINKLRLAGASEEQLKDAISLSKVLKQKEADKAESDKVKERVKSIRESVETPQEKFDKQKAELETLLSNGQIDQDTFDRALKKNSDDLNKDKKDTKSKDKGGETKFGGAFEIGSTEARSQILAHRFSGIGDPAKKLQDTNDKQLEEQKKIKEILAKTEKPTIVVANFG